MGYLNKQTITVDAILTNRGRELLAEGGGDNFNIVKFAVADDEIDYGLYTTAHPGGTPQYGALIENMPVLEVTPDEQQIMRYKLVSLGATTFGSTYINSQTGQVLIPTLQGTEDFTLRPTAQSKPITLSTVPSTATKETYTMIISNANVITVFDGGTDASPALYTAEQINANGSITRQVTNPTRSLTFKAVKNSADVIVTGTTIVTIFGNSTGATASFTITIAAS